MGKKALFICGSLNQTTIMHKIASCLEEFDNYYTPFYTGSIIDYLSGTRCFQHTILSGKHREASMKYLHHNNLPIDQGGRCNNYDLIVTCTDLIVPSNIRNTRLVLIQEGITEPENFTFPLVKYLKFPRFIANTAATGLSDAYDLFCVASQGYKNLFVRKGVRSEKIVITGLPNFDNAQEALNNDFPYHEYVLVATSSIRETGKLDDRFSFLKRVKQISNSRQVIFKLHPNENTDRAEREIHSCIPDALIFIEGNTNHMIANCSVLITQVSSVVYIGIALGKEVHSYFDLDELYQLAPIQNQGTSASQIADVCRNIINVPIEDLRHQTHKRLLSADWLSAKNNYQVGE